MKGLFIALDTRVYGDGRDAREVKHVLFLDSNKKKGDFPVDESLVSKFEKMDVMTPFELKFGMIAVERKNNPDANAWKAGITDVVVGRPAAAQ